MAKRTLRVITSVSEEEYTASKERDRQRRGTAAPLESENMELVQFTKYTGTFFTEQDMPRILTGAAKALGMNEAKSPPPVWDLDRWPLPVKKAVMDTAYRCWLPLDPGSSHMPEGASEWDPERVDEARKLFSECPGLRTAFQDEEKAVQEMAKWAENRN